MVQVLFNYILLYRDFLNIIRFNKMLEINSYLLCTINNRVKVLHK